ncbi:unnamed protein product, partial [Rotaria magnacalcarata]
MPVSSSSGLDMEMFYDSEEDPPAKALEKAKAIAI